MKESELGDVEGKFCKVVIDSFGKPEICRGEIKVSGRFVIVTGDIAKNVVPIDRIQRISVTQRDKGENRT